MSLNLIKHIELRKCIVGVIVHIVLFLFLSSHLHVPTYNKLLIFYLTSKTFARKNLCGKITFAGLTSKLIKFVPIHTQYTVELLR